MMSEAREDRVELRIGPLNVCGQGYFWAEAAQEHLSVSASSFAASGPVFRRLRPVAMQAPAHRAIPHHRLTPAFWRAHRIRQMLSKTSHLLVESMDPVLGSPGTVTLADTMPALGAVGRRVGLVFHGSDIRDPAQHQQTNEWSYFTEAPSDWVKRMSVTSSMNRELARDLGAPLFVSTPDLLLDLPEATWLPITIDPSAWRTTQAALESAIPVVLHAPSWRTPPIKGSRFVDPVLREYDSRGYIRYLKPDRVLPHSQMAQLVKSADVVIDQILTGSYGVASVEAMAAGRLVIGSVSPTTRATISDRVPILDADPVALSRLLDQILDDRRTFQSIASEGPAYVDRWHDGRAAASSLLAFLHE